MTTRSEILHLTGPIVIGADEVVPQAWVMGGQITFSRPVTAGEITSVRGWVIPGLVDAHCHVGLGKHGAVDQETSRAQALADRDAGTLLIRDAGSPADTRWIDEQEDLPKIVRAGRHIARTRRYIRNFAHEVEPEQLVGQVQAEARAGDGWVKLVGDWIDRDQGDLWPCWPGESLAEAIKAAHQLGARVTAHCFGEDCLPDLIGAGIDCIEHATGLREDTIAMAARAGITIVPTLINIATFPELAAGGQQRYPTWSAHMLELYQRRYSTIRAAHEAGIRIRVGTDAGGSLAHGLIAAEIAELVRAGLTPAQALDAGCWASRAWLGHPGLTEGAPADCVVVSEDPRRDVAVLGSPEAVILRGVRVR